MADNKPRGEQLFEKARQGNPSAASGGVLKSWVTKTLGGFFAKSGIKAGAQGQPGGSQGNASPAAIFAPRKFDIKSINQVLALILTGLLALAAYVILRRPPDIKDVAAAVSKIKFEDLSSGAVTPFEASAFYLDQVKKRDIFNEYKVYVPPPPVVEAPPPPPPPPPPKVTIQEKAKNLTLLGVSWGSDPKVIIRDEGTKEVHFLGEGHAIRGTEIKVKTITQEKVIIASDGDEMKMQ